MSCFNAVATHNVTASAPTATRAISCNLRQLLDCLGCSIDVAVGGVGDMRSAYSDFAYDPASVADESVRAKYVGEYLPKWLGYFEKLLRRAGGQYFGGSAFSFADVLVFDILDHNLRVDPACLAKLPTLQQCAWPMLLALPPATLPRYRPLSLSLTHTHTHTNTHTHTHDRVWGLAASYSCRCNRSQTRHLGIRLRPFTPACVLERRKRRVRYAEPLTARQRICSPSQRDTKVGALVGWDEQCAHIKSWPCIFYYIAQYSARRTRSGPGSRDCLRGRAACCLASAPCHHGA